MRLPALTYSIADLLPGAALQAVHGADRGICALTAAMASSERGFKLVGCARGMDFDAVHRLFQSAYKGESIPFERAEQWMWAINQDALLPAGLPSEGFGGLIPSEYQKKALFQLTIAGGLLAYDPGLGKTLIAIMAAYCYTLRGLASRERCWIIAPLNAMGAWNRFLPDLQSMFADVKIISIDSAHKLVGADRAAGGLLIIDECFPYDAVIDTDAGPIAIGDIVTKQLPVQVRVPGGFAPVTAYLKKPRCNNMVEVEHTGGTFRCTENHPIWTEEKGYVAAGSLTNNLHLSVVRQDRDPEGTERGKAEGVWNRLRPTARRAGCDPRATRNHLSGDSRTDASPESDVDAQSESQSYPLASFARLRSIEWAQGGQRAGSPEREAISSLISSLDLGPHDNDTEEFEGAVHYPEPLQARLRTRRSSARGRARRRWAQSFGSPGTGSPERSRVVAVRVVCTADQEHGPDGQPTGREGSTGDVYCLEVAGHGCFYADGVLVHNCHNAGHMTARRTKALFQLRPAFDVCIGLTGTLLHVGVEAALTMLDLCIPGAGAFATRWRAGEYFHCLVKKDLGGRSVTKLERPTGPHAEAFLAHMSRYAVVLTQQSEEVRAEAGIPDQHLHTIDMGGAEDEDVDECIIRLVHKLLEGQPANAPLPHASAIVHAALAEGAQEKWDWILDQIDDPNEGIVLFAEYHSTLDLIEDKLKSEGLSYVRVDGSITGAARESARTRFQASEVQVFLGQIEAAGESIDLYRACISVALDHTQKSWKYAQALKRTCRRGQTRECHHFDLIVNPIQSRCLKRLRAGEDFHLSLAEYQTAARKVSA